VETVWQNLICHPWFNYTVLLRSSNLCTGLLQAQRVARGLCSQVSKQSVLEDGKVVSPMHWPPLPPGSIPGTRFC